MLRTEGCQERLDNLAELKQSILNMKPPAAKRAYWNII